MSSPWNKLVSEETIRITAKNLSENGITPIIVDNAKEAKAKVLELIPDDAEVMTMQSISLLESGITNEINTSGKFNSVKNSLSKMNRETENKEMQKLGAAPEYAIGSVHAVTLEGHLLIASNTGSQLPAYAYGSEHVIWVVGTQKIVKNLDEGIKRIYDYVLAKESVRLSKQYNDPNLKSNVSKLLIINKEVKPGRLTIILVKEALGF